MSFSGTPLTSAFDALVSSLSGPQDSSDDRVFWRAALAAHPDEQWSVAATVDGAYRRGAWESLDRRTSELAAGLLLQLAL